MSRYFILLLLAFSPKLVFADCDIEKMEQSMAGFLSFSFTDENGQSQIGYGGELHTQSEVDSFQEDYGINGICDGTTVPIRLTVTGYSSYIDDLSGLKDIVELYFLGLGALAIEDLQDLANLKTLTQGFSFYGNTKLKDIDSLATNLSGRIKYISIIDTGLTEITGFNQVNSLVELEIQNNSALERIDGFDELISIDAGYESLDIEENPNLKQITAFQNLETTGGIQFTKNGVSSLDLPALKTIDGNLFLVNNFDLVTVNLPELENIIGGYPFTTFRGSPKLELINAPKLRTAHAVYVQDTLLEELSFLSKVTETQGIIISGNPFLENLEGLANIETVAGTRGVLIERNAELSSCDSIAELIGYPNGPEDGKVIGDISISNNKSGCNSIEEIFSSYSEKASSVDSDSDNVSDALDNCPNNANEGQLDFDADGLGDACDDDDDNDGYADDSDEFPKDSGEWVDSDFDGVGDNSDSFPQDPREQQDSDGDGIGNFADFQPEVTSQIGRVFLQTTSTSDNISYTHLINSSGNPQELVGTLYASDGSIVGLPNQKLHEEDSLPPKSRKIISSIDIERIFNILPWTGPAILEVQGTDSFSLMTKLTSPSGLISNTNCVRERQVENVGGFDQSEITYVRFINIGNNELINIRGTLYDEQGEVIGEAKSVLVSRLPPKGHVWRSREQLSNRVVGEWNGTATLDIDEPSTDLRLLNLNFINNETFFNFSCYESGQ